MSQQEHVTGRVVFIGNSSVGKTSLIQRYLKGSDPKEQRSTIGAVFHAHKAEVDGNSVSIQIWDTAGQERYKALGPIYYRKATAAVAVFDLTDQSSMYALDEWIRSFRDNADGTKVFVAGNKSDLEGQISLTLAETITWANQHGADCIWTSAVSGLGVDDLFSAVARYFLEEDVNIERNDKIIPVEEQPSVQKTNGCC